MATEVTPKAEYTLVLTSDERAELLQLLDYWLRETRAEAHHTRNIDYRERVRGEESLVRGLIDKVRKLGS